MWFVLPIPVQKYHASVPLIVCGLRREKLLFSICGFKRLVCGISYSWDSMKLTIFSARILTSNDFDLASEFADMLFCSEVFDESM